MKDRDKWVGLQFRLKKMEEFATQPLPHLQHPFFSPRKQEASDLCFFVVDYFCIFACVIA